MGAVGEPDRGRGAAHLLHRDAMREVAHAGAAVFLLDGDAVQPERAHRGPQLGRKAVALVDLGGQRRDLLVGEVAHRVAQQVDLGAEIMVEHRKAGVLHAAYMAHGAGFGEGPPGDARRPPLSAPSALPQRSGVRLSVPRPDAPASVQSPLNEPSGCNR